MGKRTSPSPRPSPSRGEGVQGRGAMNCAPTGRGEGVKGKIPPDPPLEKGGRNKKVLEKGGNKAVLAEADGLLAEIQAATGELRELKAEAEGQIAEMRRHWAVKMADPTARLAELDKKMRKLEKKHRLEIFGDRESVRVELQYGYLQFELSRYVKKARAITPEKLEELGHIEAVKIAKSVAWEVLETWPDWRLLALGTERVSKEIYEYGIREVGP